MLNKKKIIIHTGNIAIGGQEKMLIEFLKILSSDKYHIILLIEEDQDLDNYYESQIPKDVEYHFLTSKKFMKTLLLQKHKKNLLNKILYSINLKRKKYIALENLKKYIQHGDLIIDYDLGLLRTLHHLNIKNIPIIGWCHLGNGLPLKNKQKEKNMELYNTIITINETMKNGFTNNYGQKGVSIKKIINFVDEKEIKKLSKISMEENYLGSFILSIGALTERKNFSQLIKAYYKSSLRNNNINLVILGEGSQRSLLENLIQELHLEKNVFLLGKKPNPYNYISNSIFFVLPSKEEGFPVVLMEAMTLGKMIIAKNNSGNNEILVHGKYGILKDNVIEDFPIFFDEVINNLSLRKYYENLSLERALDFSQNKAKNIIENLIDEFFLKEKEVF
ncbi:MAG: glycosyltransferase [Cetobacterium sp.]